MSREYDGSDRKAVLAPSSHNTQPSLFHVSHSTIDLFADRDRALPVNDPNDRDLTSKRSGMQVPLDGEVAWLLPQGERPYWRGRITKIEYEFAR